jgi:hypothetical protein
VAALLLQMSLLSAASYFKETRSCYVAPARPGQDVRWLSPLSCALGPILATAVPRTTLVTASDRLPNSPKGRSAAAVRSARWHGRALKGVAVTLISCGGLGRCEFSHQESRPLHARLIPWRVHTARSSHAWSSGRAEGPKESASLDARRAFPFRLYGRSRPGRTAPSTAVPGGLLTQKGSQVQTLSRPPANG